MTAQTVTRYALTAGQTITATFQATPLTSPTPTVAYYSDAGLTTLVSGPTAMTQVSDTVWTAPVPNLAAQTLYIDYAYKTTVGGPTLHSSDDVLQLVTADVISGGALCTLAEVKLQLGEDVTTDDVELQSYIDAVTGPIEDFCGPILPRAVTEDHMPPGPELVLRQVPILSVSSVVEYVGTAAFTYSAAAHPGAGGSYTYLVDPALSGVVTRINAGGPACWVGMVRVVYQAGLSSVPANVNLAARLLVQSLWETQNGGVGLPSLADQMDPQTVISETMRSPRVRMLLEPYRRLGGIA